MHFLHSSVDKITIVQLQHNPTCLSQEGEPKPTDKIDEKST